MPLLGAQVDERKIPSAPIPKLRANAHNAAEFAPPGWKVKDQAAGDLNGDGLSDLVFVLQEQDKDLIISNESFGVREMDTNPRVLGIAFARPDGTYALATQNSELIPRWTDPRMDDWFEEGDGLKVQRGAFSVGLHYFSNVGSWYTGFTTFTFRYQHRRFELIGYADENTHRATLEESSTSVNYSTGIQVTSKASASGPVRTHHRQVSRRALLSLDQVKSGLDFQPPWTTYRRSEQP